MADKLVVRISIDREHCEVLADAVNDITSQVEGLDAAVARLKRLAGDIGENVTTTTRQAGQTSGWRPISTRPPPGTHYLGCWGSYCVAECVEHFVGISRFWMLFNGDQTSIPPHAWMPLPDPLTPPPARDD